LSGIYAVHYSEIALKGRNRPEFVRALKRNLRKAAHGLGEVSIDSREGRITLVSEADDEAVESVLSKVFGVAWYAKAEMVERDYGFIREAVLQEARRSAGSFMIAARRADKSFPTASMELARRLGKDVVDETKRGVDLSSPQTTIHVDVLTARALIYSDKTKGLGGLPVGTSGRTMHLFSGGIDSPVAAWLMMKRGCQPVYAHFYLAPSADYPLMSKVARLVSLLAEYGGRTRLVLLPFAEYQLATSGVPPDAEPSLFRRFTRMTAELLAASFGATAISTGDSLSQAASQTLWNMAVFDSGSSMPILRPLLGYDKDEIVQLARRIGSYEPSIEEYKDCCAIITRHPRTRAKQQLIDSLSASLNFSALAGRCISLGTMATFDPRRPQPDVTPLNEFLMRRAMKLKPGA
jgi:thiamine biosynthesis protein ThiI